MENFPVFADYILALLFGVLLPFVSGVKSTEVFKQLGSSFTTGTKIRFYLGNSFFLFLLAFVIIIAWYLFDRPFSVLGFTTPSQIGKSYPWWMIILFILLYAMDVLYSINDKSELTQTKKQLESHTPFMPTKWVEMPAYIVMCISAGVFEEIVFRGYMVNFFKYLFDGFPALGAWAVMTPAVIFSVAHYYQGAKAVFKILVLSMLFGMIFWQTNSLYAVMLLHFMVDFVAGFLSIKLADKNEELGKPDNFI